MAETKKLVVMITSGLDDDDRLLVVERNGRAKAYPIRILTWHEVVNDKVGGEPIAVTYCPLCGTGMAFDLRVNGRTLELGVSGLSPFLHHQRHPCGRQAFASRRTALRAAHGSC